LSIVIAVAIALSMPNIYRAEALLSPVNSDDGGMNGLANKFGGLAFHSAAEVLIKPQWALKC
jgi:hypothetical protein